MVICARATVMAHTADTRRVTARIFIGPQSNVQRAAGGWQELARAGSCTLLPAASCPLPADRIQSLDDQDIYAAIGEEGFTRLIAAFYKQVPGDDILGPMYPPRDLA